jgi:hypothetical protein
MLQEGRPTPTAAREFIRFEVKEEKTEKPKPKNHRSIESKVGPLGFPDLRKGPICPDHYTIGVLRKERLTEILRSTNTQEQISA